jgi:ABC-type branched-subunit amino acid transport system substrate-binding protein
VTGFSNVIAAQISLSNEQHVVLLAPLESTGVINAGQYSFSHSVTFPDLAPYFRDYWRHAKARRIYAFLINNAYGQSIAPVVGDAARASGAVYDQAFVDFGMADIRGVVARAKEFNPDEVFIAIQGTLLEPAVVRALRELDITAQICIPGTWYQQRTWRAAAGPYAEGIVFGGLYVNPASAGDFVRAFRDRTGADPSYGDAELYDMGQMLAYAIGKGGYNGDGIRNALLDLRGVPSIFGGQIEMQANHFTKIRAIGLWQVRAGNLVAVKV